jgi:endonuclease
VLVHDDAGGFKPLNWMTGPTQIEELGDVLFVRKQKSEDVLEIRLAEILSDVVHDMGESAALQKDRRRARPAARAGRRAVVARRGAEARSA